MKTNLFSRVGRGDMGIDSNVLAIVMTKTATTALSVHTLIVVGVKSHLFKLLSIGRSNCWRWNNVRLGERKNLNELKKYEDKIYKNKPNPPSSWLRT